MDSKKAAMILRKWAGINRTCGPDYDSTVEAQEMGAAALEEVGRRFRAPIVCMCGSTRFKQTWIAENARLTGEGNVVLSVGLWGHHERQYPDAETKLKLDELHKRKIDLADWVWVLDVGGYIGESTKSEIEYAKEHGKTVRYLSVEFPEYKESVDPLLEEVERLRERVARLESELRAVDSILARREAIDKYEHRVDKISIAIREAAKVLPLQQRIAELESRLNLKPPPAWVEEAEKFYEQPDRYVQKGVISQRRPK